MSKLTVSIRQTTSVLGREAGAEDGPEEQSRVDDCADGKDEHRWAHCCVWFGSAII